jgi:hypothetical protein
MNKKGASVGSLILFAVVVIVAAALIPTIFGSQSTMTDSHVNTAQYTTAAASSSTYVTGQELLSTPTVVNESATINCVANVTFAEVVRTDTGFKGISMTSVAAINRSLCSKVNVSYTYGADGYVEDTGGRSMASLIGLFSCLALLGAAAFYWYKENGLDFF